MSGSEQRKAKAVRVSLWTHRGETWTDPLAGAEVSTDARAKKADLQAYLRKHVEPQPKKGRLVGRVLSKRF